MGVKILVVENDAVIKIFLESVLDTFGYDVRIATNGVEALNIIASTSFDHLVTNIKMPLMDGITLINELKRLHIHIPNIIVCTGQEKTELPEYLWTDGIRYLPKPFRLAQLEELMETSPQSWLDSGGLGTHHNFPHLLT